MVNLDINLKDIQVDNVSIGSGVFYGKNFLNDFKSVSTQNEGLGTLNGDHNKTFKTKHLIKYDQ